VAELGLLPGQNLTGRCLTLDTSSQVLVTGLQHHRAQETLPITVAGVADIAAKAANTTGATAVVVECTESGGMPQVSGEQTDGHPLVCSHDKSFTSVTIQCLGHSSPALLASGPSIQ
jgi:hypothetical protein